LTQSNLTAKTIELKAGNNASVTASNVMATERADITAKQVSINGQEAPFNNKVTSGSVGVSLDAVQGGFAITANAGHTETEGRNYVSANISAPILNINAANQSIDGANINDQAINPHEQTTSSTNSYGGGIAFNPFTGQVSASASFNDFSVFGGGGQSGGFIGGGYNNFIIGSNLTPGSGRTGTGMGLFGGYAGIGTVGLNHTTTNGTSSHDVWSPTFNIFGISGGASFQEGNYIGSNINFGNHNLFSYVNGPFNYTCFPAGTKVRIRRRRANGSFEELDLEIEEVQTGDEVLTINEKTNELEWKYVIDTYQKKNDVLYELNLSNGTVVKPTGEHPFWVNGLDAWLPSAELKVGLKLLDLNLEEVEIISIQVIQLKHPIAVYNLNVKDNHNYFAEGILVHNYNEANGTKQNDVGSQTMTVLSGEVTQPIEQSGQVIHSEVITNETLYRGTLNNTINDLIDITRNNTNLSEASRIVYVSQLQQAQNNAANYTSVQLRQYSNPVYQQVANTVLQIQNEQTQAALNDELLLTNVRNNLSASQDSINKIVNNIDRTVPDSAQKQELISHWQSLSNQLKNAETGAGLFDAGLTTAGGIAAVAGGVVALVSGTAAAATIATLSQTPAGRQILSTWFSQAFKSEIEAINNDPFMQSLYGEALKQGIEYAAALAVFNGLILRGVFGLVLTAPSGGQLIANEGRSLSLEEAKIANLLVNEGRRVEVIAESNTARTADFLVDGVATELKTVSNITSNDISGALSSRILEGAGQAPNIIIDGRNQAGLTQELAEKSVLRAYGRQRQLKDERISSVRIIGDNFDINIPYLTSP
jgi:hypothetical protein